jgi:hypothetical protein
MMTVRELFSENPVIPFIFSSFCPRGDENYTSRAYFLFFRIGIPDPLRVVLGAKNALAET